MNAPLTVLRGDAGHPPRKVPGRARRGVRCDDPAPGLTRGPDLRRTAPPPETPDPVRDGGRSRQDPAAGRDVQNVGPAPGTCPETYETKRARP